MIKPSPTYSPREQQQPLSLAYTTTTTVSNPTSAISNETIANPNAQIVEDDMVRVQVPRCMAWLDYDEHVDSLSTMDNEVGVTSPESTTQTLPSFEEYTSPVTYPKEVEKTLGTPIEVEPLNETKPEEVGLNCNHNTPLSSREVPSFDGPEPQPLLNSPSLDVSLGDVIGPVPPIKPHSPNSSRIKVVDYLTTQTPPLPHVANSHPKGVYSYYNLGINDHKRHYGFKPGLLGKSVSLGVGISNWEMFDDDWGLESKKVSPLGEELSLFYRPNEVDRGRILEAHRLDPILQQQSSQRMAPSHHDGAGEGVRIYPDGVASPAINYRVTCEDEAKRRNSGAKTKTFEENCYLLLYAVSNKEDTAYQRPLITRIRVVINSLYDVSLYTYTSLKMDNPNITMEEYIRLQEEKALSRGETFNWQTATYGKMEYYEDEDDYFTNFETKFRAIVLDNTLTSDTTLSCGPTVSPLNDNEIDFRISFDESDDENYMVV
ncbi:hypothetical protein Tco_0205104 [Tanacetum coccineum]